jgi:hypothetical protein
MSQPSDRHGDPNSLNQGWATLYRIGAAAALIAVILFRRNFGTELVTFRGFGLFDVPEVLPSTALGWFTLLQENRLIGLLLLDVVDLINYALLGLIFLALCGALRRASKSATVIAVVTGLMGIAIYFASNQALSILSLSHQYATATTEAQRTMLLAAGEALLAMHNPGAIHQGTGIYLGLLLVTIAALVFSVIMLRSSVFGRATALVGIVATVSQLGYFVALPLAFAVVALPFVVSAPFRLTWYVLIAVKLFRLAARRTANRGEAIMST